ncbi:acyl-CoA N-acyltransferase [Scenedesmus sp. NREL 46B-D3]|nr:acyl-CoA N-acyltransferase [Scenedesmus sp. NREL 46B-D3]
MAQGSYSHAVPSMFFRPPTLDDLEVIHDIEASSYPEDEAASYENLKYRIEQASGQFLVAIKAAGDGSDSNNADQLVGYVCGTCSNASSLTHESMSTHEPDGRLLCIHSVAVQQQHRRRGIASRMLQLYLCYVRGTTAGLQEVRLICKEQMIPLYSKAGFVLLGPSEVEHGQEQWHEMAWRTEGDS